VATSATCLALACHPLTPTAFVRSISVGARRTAASGFVVSFDVAGHTARLHVSPAREPRVARRLWEHTCCEAFLSTAPSAGPDERGAFPYHELNLSPSGEWAGYAFASYREPSGPVDESLAPRIAVALRDDGFTLEAEVALDRLAPEIACAPLRVGLAAVIEDADGALSYWALRHPPGAPDFHHADGFALRLEAPGGE
jgi:hypothetical protein